MWPGDFKLQFYQLWSLISLEHASGFLNSCQAKVKKDSFAHTGCKPLGGSVRQCEWGLFYLLVRVSFDSEDLKRLRALSPLGQKHAFWNRTGNLPIVQRNVLTTEPRLQIWHIKMRIIAIIKSNCKKKFTTRKTCWIAVWLPANSGAESHNEDRTQQL